MAKNIILSVFPLRYTVADFDFYVYLKNLPRFNIHLKYLTRLGWKLWLANYNIRQKYAKESVMVYAETRANVMFFSSKDTKR